jgi:ribosomal RNA-processing protein 9
MSSIRRKRSSSTKIPPGSKRAATNIDFSLGGGGRDQDRTNKNRRDDDSIDSEDDESLASNGDKSMDSSDEEEKETVDEKRVRLARNLLSTMEKAEEDDSSDAPSSSSDEMDSDGDDDLEEEDRIGKRLERERLKKQGILELMLAKKVQYHLEEEMKALQSQLHECENDAKGQAKIWVQNNKYKLCRGHDLTPTCVALHAPTGTTAYSASKDNSIIMWDVDTQCKLHTIEPRWHPNKCEYTRNSGEVLSMVASDDGRYLAVGGRDATVKIYDVRQKKAPTGIDASKNKFDIRGLATTFEGHKGPVTALAFRSKSLQLFSGSNDRCIRHYNLQELTYIETLYGHQAAVSGISCYGMRHEIPFSVGRDRTARAWKIAEESHLIFRGGAKASSADCIASMKDDWFLTGHDDGALNLWTMTKKKTVRSIETAHGLYDGNVPRGIVSCATVGGTDLAITGSNDGYMRLWNVSFSDRFYFIRHFQVHTNLILQLYYVTIAKVLTGDTNAERGLHAMGKIPIHGYINDIAIGPKAKFCVAAVGQEPRLGRWDRIPAARNRFAIIPLRSSNDNEGGDEEVDDDNKMEDFEEEAGNSDSSDGAAGADE